MDREGTIKLTVKSLLEVVQTGAKNIEIAVMAPGKPLEMLKVEDIEKYVESINSEKQDEAATRRGPRAGGQAGASTTAPVAGAEAVLASRPAGDGGSGAPTE
jgi:20S proteasome subunit alpha 4